MNLSYEPVASFLHRFKKLKAAELCAMTESEAFALALDLRRSARVRTGGTVRLRADVEKDRIVFSGGSKGTHSLAFNVSSPDRVRAHWEGYCEANGAPRPIVGQRVAFVGANGTAYTGTVTKAGPKRVTLTFRFRHGGESSTTRPYHEVTTL